MKQYVNSIKWKFWDAILDDKTCLECKKGYGKIYAKGEVVKYGPKIHAFCRCAIVTLKAILAGTATDYGRDGADWWLLNHKRLPDYYISKEEAISKGWVKELGNLHEVAPGKMLFGGIYENRNGKLPHKDGRVWYEADINYINGWRGVERILFSNDGLIFVSHTHYETFQEII